MLIGIISDTHDRLDSIAKALDIFKKEQVDMILHCGDWVSPFTMEFFDATCQEFSFVVPVKSVFGNNEGDRSRIFERNINLHNPIKFSSKLVMDLEIDSKKIAVFHGHDKSVLSALINSQTYDAVFTGHTHVPRNELTGKTLVFNPGSTAWVRGSQIIKEASVGIYNSLTNQARLEYLQQ